MKKLFIALLAVCSFLLPVYGRENKISAAGNAPDELLRVAVSGFRINASSFAVFGAEINAAKWEKALRDAVNIYMTQTRKFTMLDRDFDAEVNAEFARLNDPNASPHDAIRLGKKLMADYLITGTAAFNNVHPPEKNPFTGKYIMPSQTVFVTINYRVIHAATGQLKWADSIQIDGGYFFDSLVDGVLQDSADYAAGVIGDGIVSCIFPYEIVGLNPDGTVIIGEGGKTFEPGEFFSVYNLGPEVTDTRTGRVIDRSEIRTGMVKIIRCTEKLAYAIVVEGRQENIKIGARLRVDELSHRAAQAHYQKTQPPAPPAGTVQSTTGGGVVVPF